MLEGKRDTISIPQFADKFHPQPKYLLWHVDSKPDLFLEPFLDNTFEKSEITEQRDCHVAFRNDCPMDYHVHGLAWSSDPDDPL